MTARRVPSVGRPRLAVPRIPWRPLGGFLGPRKDDVVQSLGALAFSAVTSLVAGLTLAANEERFDELTGLLLFIPAAIGLRGNVFGPFGSRLSTAIQTGTFSWSLRADSVLGQNLVAVFVNSVAAGLGLAVVAEALALSLEWGGAEPITLADFIIISIVGGLLASVVVGAATLGLTVASVRFDWDLDNVTAPMVTAAGDLITLPALVVSTVLVRQGGLTVIAAAASAGVAFVSLLGLARSGLANAKRIVLETLPVLIGAGVLSLVAGLAIESAQDRLDWVMLVLLPGYLGTAGALGGILANRLSTKIHLGLVDPTLVPRGTSRSDMGFTTALALPIFLFLALVAAATAAVADQATPGLALLLAVVISAGLVSTLFVLFLAYYGTLLVVRFGLDPDNFGIPIVTASLDVIGALTLVAAVVAWGVA